jgi:1-acyl-sn-glycerol-3-phosphate acyltransferase
VNPIPAHSLALTPYPSRVARALRVVLHLLRAMLMAALFYRRMGTHRQLAFKQRWSQQLLKILEIHLEAGVADAPAGCLIAANHISWLDIFVINALRPAAFVAKAEVRAWPLIGWLAARNDTIFVNRSRRQHARQVKLEIDTRLNSGFDVAVFPEGRTTDGVRLLEFHAALLQSAIETGRPILPMAISYHDANGQPSLAPSFAETTLPQCFTAILACRSLSARLMPLPPIATTGQSRRDVAHAAHDVIATRLGFLRPNRTPGTPPDLPA